MDPNKLTAKEIPLIVASFLLAFSLLSGHIAPEHKHTIQLICFSGLALIILFLKVLPSRKQDDKIEQEAEPFTGDSYKIQLDDNSISLIQTKTNVVQTISWRNLTEVYIHAIDNYPVGSMHFELREGEKVLEIPTDAENNNALLKHMQTRLPNFDNHALIEATMMLSGSKKLWS
jgi:hypothetical protein